MTSRGQCEVSITGRLSNYVAHAIEKALARAKPKTLVERQAIIDAILKECEHEDRPRG